jgi:hypothetical protein
LPIIQNFASIPLSRQLFIAQARSITLVLTLPRV